MKHVPNMKLIVGECPRPRRSRRQGRATLQIGLKAKHENLYPSSVRSAGTVYGHCRGQYWPKRCCPRYRQTMLQKPRLPSPAVRADGAAGRLRNEHALPGRRADARIGIKPLGILLEPVGPQHRAAVAAAANYLRAHRCRRSHAVLPADHVINNVDAFHQAVAAMRLAMVKDGALATFGIVPSAPETGTGYIQSGASAGSAQCYKVDRS